MKPTVPRAAGSFSLVALFLFGGAKRWAAVEAARGISPASFEIARVPSAACAILGSGSQLARGCLTCCFALLWFSVPSAAAALTPADAEARLRVAMQVARERNDQGLVAAVAALERSFKAKLPADAEERLRELEKDVGLDPGGWSMAGQPLFHPTPEMLSRAKNLAARLDAAMKADEPKQVRAVTAEMLALLGDQAGVPDGRRRGRKVAANPVSEAAATRLFCDALKSEDRRVRQLAGGKPLPDQMVRVYGDILQATATIRPFAARHQPDDLPMLDKLASGLTDILLKLQQPDGHFPFPDLRGKNVRFGDMTDQQLRAGRIELRDGWIVSVDADGGSQFDTSVCGVALLLAGQGLADDTRRRAGVRAADWALGQSCCANFNYNAFSVSLLAHAFTVTGAAKYLDGALKKFRVGVAPGQAPNGRWLDSHNARTVYHVIILRALGDLAEALPADRSAERAELQSIIGPAVRALLDEFDAMGMTVEALPELLTLSQLNPRDARLRAAVESMATGLVEKSTDGQRVRMGAQPHQLASVARVWR